MPAGHEALASSLQPLVVALKDGTLTLPWKDIAAATVFTTGDPSAQLVQMAEWVRTTAVTKPATNWTLKGTSKGYTLYVGMEAVPQLFGGVIPTDIQGMYWYGLQGVSTACDTPYYHTTEDTPEKVDTAFLAKTAGHFVAALEALDRADPAAFRVRDPHLWTIDAKTTSGASGLAVDVVATTAARRRNRAANSSAR